MMDGEDLAKPFGRVLQAIGAPERIRAIEAGASAEGDWQTLERSGFLDLLVPEPAGGAGLPLSGAWPLIALAGTHAIPLPIAETMAARALFARAGVAVPRGPIVLVTSPTQPVPCGLAASHAVIDTGEALVLAETAALSVVPTGVHGSLAARIAGSGEGVALVRPTAGLRPLAAVLRAALIAGAAEQLTAMTSQFANERVQFGKPIGRQQALQHNLAIMAEDMVACRLASQLGCDGGIDVSEHRAAAAKSVTSAAVPRIAATAHAVHGAIGISEEFGLHLLTRRLHEWRLADGSESYWSQRLGASRLASPKASVEWVRTELSGPPDAGQAAAASAS